MAIGLLIIAALLTARSSLSPGSHKGSGAEAGIRVQEPGEKHTGSAEISVPPTVPIPDNTENGIARNVGGGLVAAPDMTGGPLERVAALPQAPPPKPAFETKSFKPKQVLRWRLIFNSVISAAGVFDLNGTALVLPGIDIVPVNHICTAPNGTEWPCGMVARTAFRNFVKGRAITCRMPDMPLQESYAAECLLAGQDMSAWLVEQGWARAQPATTYVDLETSAKGYGRGIYGNPPRGVEAVNRAETAPALPTIPAANP